MTGSERRSPALEGMDSATEVEPDWLRSEVEVPERVAPGG